MSSYSQVGQDLEIVKYYNGLRDGYFVDIGATNGIALSNTYLLETQYDWKGICVEPIPSAYEELVKNRKAHCLNRAVYNTTDQEVNFTVAHNHDLSGIYECLDLCKDQIDNGGREQDIKATTITLTDLLDKYKAPSFIHYLSLDTEGSELEILKAMDFTRYTFGRIDVEHNFMEPRRTLMRNLLSAYGYEYIGANQQDDCYSHAISPKHSHKSTKSSVQFYLRWKGL